MKRYFGEFGGVFIVVITLLMISPEVLIHTLFAQDRPVKVFSITVQETTITLLEDPKKEVSVWAYVLKGEKPSVPGPVIRVHKGDLVKVHFTNTHHLPHTMHFHGVHPFNMDGNGQRDMGREQLQMPGESYTYEWVAKEPGFYLYHCHFDTANHLDHGMYGLFIVEDPSWPQVDRELVTFWDEWDTDGDSTYETHTINSHSAPSDAPLKAKVGERVRLVLANVGFEFHTPHLHGHTWSEVNPGTLERPGWNNPNGVVSIGPAEIKVVEFVAKHSGTWLLHCHILPHVTDDEKYPRGMLTRLEVQDDKAKETGKPLIEKDQQIEGKEQSQQTQVASIQDFQPFDYPDGMADRGHDVYKKNCKACHGDFAQGDYGPKLEQNPILHNDDQFWKTLLKGRANMPAWEGRLSFQKIADVHAYLKTLSPTEP
ncbi:MAG: hypothetical protein NPIRA01_03320 [Nitrospirales bacterium]|nr:MAG: hypothetical protein NPIRA01_03320 [Nitrospirales bacterium]